MNRTIVLLVALAALTAGAAAQQFGPWSAPVNLGPVVNSAFNDQHPALSKDGLSLIFASDRPGGAGEFDLYVSQRDSLDSPWQAPQNITVLNTPFRDFAPNLTNDGHWLFFHSNRPGGCGGQDLWAAHRQNKRDDFGWEEPINLGCTLNTLVDDAGPTFFEDDDTGTLYLYFTRNDRPNTPNSDAFDIYVSTCTADLDSCNRQQLWSPGVLVPELSSPVRDTRTAIRRRDGLEMILASNRAGGVGSGDLWVSTRASIQDPWSIPVNLDADITNPIVNSTAFDGAPALSWDGQTLIFYSMRPGGLGGSDLYMSTRAKLPHEAEGGDDARDYAAKDHDDRNHDDRGH